MTRFDLVYLALTPIATALLGYRSLRHGKYRESTPAMLGRRLHEENADQWKNGCVWVHAVSVGEVIAARAMLPLLREKFSPLPILLTTVTETGQAQARSLPEGLADAVRYYPWDFSWVVKQFADVYRPKVFIPMETELWPNALNEFSRRGTKVFVLNGKITPKSFRSYNRLRGLLGKAFGNVTAYCMQTEADAERVRALTGKPDRVFITGNCKFDVPLDPVTEERKAELRAMTHIADGQQVVVVGSTHPGEDEIVIQAAVELSQKFPSVCTLIAPRHPERFDAVWKLVQASGLRVSRASLQNPGASPQVVLVDKMGILSQLYSIADVAVVAGSLVPGIGGHNILEAAAHGVPVVYGPYMNKQPDMVRILADNGGTMTQPDQLVCVLEELLTNREAALAKGQRGAEAVLSNRGTAQRNMKIIDRFVP